MHKHFLCHAELKAASDPQGNSGRRLIKGYFSTKDLDRYKDVVEPSAFKDTVDTFMKNPILFFNHYWGEGIGKILSIAIDKTGAFVEAEIAQGTQLADTVWTLIQQGVYNAFSFGFRITSVENISDEAADAQGIKERRRIKGLDLLEVSVVTVPANAHAVFSMVKGIEWGTDMYPLTPVEDLIADSLAGIKTDLAGLMQNVKAVSEAHQEADNSDTSDEQITEDEKGATAFSDLPLADGGMAWVGARAKTQLAKWASSDGSGDKSKIDWEKFSKGFFWFDSKNSDKLTAYKLPFCYVLNGALTAVPRGIFAAAASVRGARGGASLPPEDMPKVQGHIEKYYKKMGKDSPFKSRPFDEDVAEFLDELPEGKKAKVLLETVLSGLEQMTTTLKGHMAPKEEGETTNQASEETEASSANRTDGKEVEGGDPQGNEDPENQKHDEQIDDLMLKLASGLNGLQDLISNRPN